MNEVGDSLTSIEFYRWPSCRCFPNIWKAVLYYEVDMIPVCARCFLLKCRLFYNTLYFQDYQLVFPLFATMCVFLRHILNVYFCGNFPSCDSMSCYFAQKSRCFCVLQNHMTSRGCVYGWSLSNTQASRWENYLCIVSTNG